MKTEMTEGETYNPYNMFIGSMVPEWIEQATELSFGEKACFARLARYAGRDGKCFPSMSSIGESLGVSERQAKRLVGSLKAKGLIQSRQRGLGKSNTYVFVANTMMQDAKLKDDDGTMLVTSQSLRQGLNRPDGRAASGMPVVPDAEHIRESDQESPVREPTEEESFKREDQSKEELPTVADKVRKILRADRGLPRDPVTGWVWGQAA
jgi:DNA-binding MarR family transcriptional regulator